MLVSAGIAPFVSERAVALISTVVLGGAAYVLLRPAVGEPFRYVGFRCPSPKLIGYAVLASLGILIPVMSLEALALLRFKVPQELIDALTRLITAKTYPELVYVVVVAAVSAAVCEELVFRGILQKSLASRMRPWAAILVTSIIFALLHTIWRTPPALVLGVFLGFLYWRTQSLVLPMLSHFTVNTVSIVAAFVTEKRGEMAMPVWIREEKPAPVWMILVSLAVFALAFRALWKEGAPPDTPTL
jgi:membrane protease YdiL (CAAX protease family)